MNYPTSMLKPQALRLCKYMVLKNSALHRHNDDYTSPIDCSGATLTVQLIDVCGPPSCSPCICLDQTSMGSPSPTPTATIRERSPADLPGASALLVSVYNTDRYPVEGVPNPTEWLTSPSLLQSWVAELNGEIVGHVSVTRPMSVYSAAQMWKRTPEGVNDNVAAVVRLFVLGTIRGQSLGRKLMIAASDYAEHEGLRLVLDVLEKDHGAIAFYERLGWKRIGEAMYNAGDAGHWKEFCYVSPR